MIVAAEVDQSKEAADQALLEKPLVHFPRHFYSLDALRGIAALVIAVYHWPNFFYHGTSPDPHFKMEQLPFFSILRPLYVDGWRAVDLFFCLSGFIFYWLYSDKVAARHISVKEFFLFRFSRLYPLHLVTLIAVAIGQTFLLWGTGSYFIYRLNDLYHFALQLVFASSWGFERGFSFNGPIWSVSVEVLLYTLFFASSLVSLRRFWRLAAFAVIGYLLIKVGSLEVRRGILAFFTGGISFYILARIASKKPSYVLIGVFAALTILSWSFVPWLVQEQLIPQAYRKYVGTMLFVAGLDPIGSLLSFLCNYSLLLLLFPLTLITLALWEMRQGPAVKKLEFLGNMSYSCYLLHFPLQLCIFGLAASLSVSSEVFCSPWLMLMFFAALVPLSLLCYWFFERPCQMYIRRRLLAPTR